MVKKPSKKTDKTSAKKPRTRKSTKTKNLKLTEKVPDEYAFWCCDGRRFTSMKDLAEALSSMSDEVYIYHVNVGKNDFYNWVRDIIQDVELANSLLQTTSRIEAARCVANRLIFLAN